MSVVTNIILTCSVLEETDGAFPSIEFVNRYLSDTQKGVLHHVSAQAGGDRVIESKVFLGAFNHLDEDRFCEVLLNAPWEVKEHVQVMVKRNDDVLFTTLHLTENAPVWHGIHSVYVKDFFEQ